MISYTELQTRLARFVDAEMLPHMTGGKRILLGGCGPGLPVARRLRTLSPLIYHIFRADEREKSRLLEYTTKVGI